MEKFRRGGRSACLNWLNKVVDVTSDSTDLVSLDSQLNSSTQATLEDDDDDDCVILDCDPDKTGAAVESKADDDDNDEVLVVGQKGEIACRDFPHPRHSCAKYSFNSTAHESYCDMEYCPPNQLMPQCLRLRVSSGYPKTLRRGTRLRSGLAPTVLLLITQTSEAIESGNRLHGIMGCIH
ncbi:unnamed protein product [Eruca vesicaria subsp. sativa]|uniref:Uncharacterized protein n=1 Tax=Eruca vesicaria subsp. sativa TaxID=29727 RepID=A0ABC8KFX7_ERUVS|nr:unnamed protein product [Eruca vesicaria subsp. sativa]